MNLKQFTDQQLKDELERRNKVRNEVEEKFRARWKVIEFFQFRMDLVEETCEHAGIDFAPIKQIMISDDAPHYRLQLSFVYDPLKTFAEVEASDDSNS